ACTPPFHAKGVVSSSSRRSPGLRVRFVAESASASALPGIVPSGRLQISSLTLARQRGPFTRVPVLIERWRRANQGIEKDQLPQETQMPGSGGVNGVAHFPSVPALRPTTLLQPSLARVLVPPAILRGTVRAVQWRDQQ